jgi:AAA15 family ATPase/GTPase
MIDEIDTDIHYSRMKNFLKTIFQVAEKNDVQLFMTTHSLECQEAFAEVFGDPDMIKYQSKARNYSLVEDQSGQIVANKLDYEQQLYWARRKARKKKLKSENGTIPIPNIGYSIRGILRFQACTRF